MPYLLKFYFIVSLFLLSGKIFAQDSTRFYSTIDTLCSSHFYGRGYINEGHIKTAKYLQAIFNKADKVETQDFSFSLNLMQDQLFLALDDDTLSTCYDYIPLPQSSGGQGSFKILSLDSNFFQSEKQIKKFLSKNISKRAIVYPAKFEPLVTDRPLLKNKIYNSAGCVIKLTPNDLLKSFSRSPSMPPAYSVREELFKDQKKAHFIVEQTIKEITASNVIATIKGADPSLKEIIICAHYDHVGGYESCFIPGANDNATGVSMLIELFHYYSTHQPKRNIKFIAFAGEETGLIGSYNYVEKNDLSSLHFVLNLDLYGAGSEGITVVNGKTFKDQFNILTTINNDSNLVTKIRARGEAANSDHYYFSKKGIPAFFIYSNGHVGGYHNIKDTPEKLEKGYFNSLFTIIRYFLDSL